MEWECLFDKFPTDDQQEKLKQELKDYIENYLDKLVSYKHEVLTNMKAKMQENDDAQFPGSDKIDEIEKEINETFPGIIIAKGQQGQVDKKDLLINFSKWDKDNKNWTTIDKPDYGRAVIQNFGSNSGEKTTLKYTVYTKKWIDIFKHKLVRVSDTYLVFSYQGWFETKNRVRLTDASGENRGSMNPPNPPPPPR